MQNKLIIVSNRLPYTIKKNEDRFEVITSSGGLVSAIQSMQNENKITWVGAADFSEEDWKEYNQLNIKQDIEIIPLFLEKETESLYYNGFSNTLLWPLFHYFTTIAEYNEVYYEAYKTVNRIFSEAISVIASKGDIVWVHDYHLMLVPGMLKQGNKKVNSSFFLHIPFPSYEIVKLIPQEWRDEILKSLVQADVIGFHTKEYCSHFKNALSFFLGIECVNNCIINDGNVSLVKDYPISIDYQKFNSAYDDKEVARERKQIHKKYDNVKIIFSLDRLDYTKGVLNRLQAFEKLLENNAELREQVVFIINVIPSRETISQYAERKRLIEENISRINGLYCTLQWQPVIYQYRHLSFKQLLACYTSCDIALVTPLRDGMNLVAKEFAASRKDHKGCLILSEFAGAANELEGALLVNPNDIHLMQEAMLQAISLPEAEQKKRMRKMQTVIQKNDINKWMNTFLQDAMAESSRGNVTANIMSYYDKIKISEAYKRAGKRLILLDYDGTLIPFYNKPEEAIPGNMIKELISKLNNDPDNTVLLISGRDADTLENWFKDMEIGIVAEHGMLYRPPGSNEWKLPGEINLAWKESVKSYLEKYILSMPGSFIEEKKYSVAWHYRVIESIDEEAVRLSVSKDLMPLNLHNDFNILHGNKVIEIKSAHTNKGKFVKRLIKENDFNFILAVGDDSTDEDMFHVLKDKHQYTIKVGHGNTGAKFNIVGVNQVLSFLNQLHGSHSFHYGDKTVTY